ncbi:heparin lyase I family protein [Blastococcus sp. SYSU DS0619]
MKRNLLASGALASVALVAFSSMAIAAPEPLPSGAEVTAEDYNELLEQVEALEAIVRAEHPGAFPTEPAEPATEPAEPPVEPTEPPTEPEPEERAVLPAPSDVTVRSVDQRAVADWADVENAADYVIRERRTPDELRVVTESTRTSPVLSLTDPDYYYSVAARDADGVIGTWSAEVHVVITAPTTAAAPTPPPPAEPEPAAPAAQPARVWDYEPGGSLVPPWMEIHALRSDQHGITTENPYPGTTRSAFFTVKRGDTGWNGTRGTLRSEVRDSIANSGNVKEGTDQWWAWPTFFPADFDWDERGQFLIFTQWHQTVNSGNPNVHFWSDVNEHLMVDVRGGTGGRVAGDAQYTRTFDLGLIDKGSWNDFMVHFVWSSDPSKGLIEVWHQGERVLSENVANLYVGQSVYIKQGIYSAAGTNRVHRIQHSVLRHGPTRASVEGLPSLD